MYAIFEGWFAFGPAPQKFRLSTDLPDRWMGGWIDRWMDRCIYRYIE
jgi:hypothetical protein